MARGDLPTYADWQRVAGALGLRRKGAELVGPCPACGGDDRFHVNDRRRDGTAALFGCRQCHCNDVAAILRAAFPDRHGLAQTNGAPRAATPSAQGKPRKTAARSEQRRRHDPVYGDDLLKEEARRWWRNAAPVTDGTPAHIYLAARHVLEAAADAERVRWLDQTPWRNLTNTPPRVRLKEPAYPNAKPPAQAVGAILYPYRTQTGTLEAVAVEPLDRQGNKAERRDGNRAGFMVGRVGNAWHQARPQVIATEQQPLAICEGPLDAWAIADVKGTEAWAAGSASVLPAKASELAATGREIQLWPDGDPPGRHAAGALQALLLNEGAKAHIVPAKAGSDPHEQLTGNGT